MKQKYKWKNRQRNLRRKFGVNEYGFVDFPIKISGTTLRRIENDMGCCFCFPHGWECYNSTGKKARNRNWKRYRRRQWREI